MMSNFKKTYDLRMALNEALRENDILAHQVNVLENETHADQICGY